MDNLKIDVLKEPRGFMRVLQFIFAICAFATTTNFSSKFSFTVKCKNTSNETVVPPDDVHISQEIAYPYRFDHIIMDTKACGKDYSFPFFGDYSSDAEFFVAAGVLAMLYAGASVGFYLLFDNTYQNNKTIPLIDFLMALVLGVFWLSGSAAWASGLSSVKYVCDPNMFIKSLRICIENAGCVASFAGNFAGLNISIIFGFLNFFLWAANLWFLYKETTWFHNPAVDATGQMPV